MKLTTKGKKLSADGAEGADGTEVLGWVDQSQYLRLSAAICGWGWFLVDKLVAGGLDDWEVKIADFVPSTAKPATRQVFCWGKMR